MALREGGALVVDFASAFEFWEKNWWFTLPQLRPTEIRSYLACASKVLKDTWRHFGS